MKDNHIYLAHIHQCAEIILVDYYGGLKDPRALFLSDDKTQQATLHRLETLGEAANRLPSEIQLAVNPLIDWRGIADFRNVVAHNYLGIDLDIVWNVVQEHLPILLESVKSYLERNHS